MKRIIALPLEGGVLCAHFGHCEAFAFVSVEDNIITDIKEISPPEHVPGLYPRWIAQFGVSDVIAGGMGQKAIMLFNEQSINAFVGAPVRTAKELVEDFLVGNLQLSANYCNHGDQPGHTNCSH
jgi:predicted Fe-Mo cluster-binding NifX family protein